MKKEPIHVLITYEDGTEVLKKPTEEIEELFEISLGKRSVFDTNKAKFGKVQKTKWFDEEGYVIAEKEY